MRCTYIKGAPITSSPKPATNNRENTLNYKIPVQDRLQLLIDHVHPGSPDPYTPEQVAALTAKDAFKISTVEVERILSGDYPDPSGRHLRALARTFEMPIEFFRSTDKEEWEIFTSVLITRRKTVTSLAERQAAALEQRQIRREKRRQKMGMMPPSNSAEPVPED